MRRIASVGRNFEAHQVYGSDAHSAMCTGGRWLTRLWLGWLIANWRRPRSLLDNTPLSELLQTLVPLDRLPD